MKLALVAVALLWLLAAPARALDLLRGSGDSAILGCFAPPGLDRIPSDPDVAFVACTDFPVGVFPFWIGPGAPVGPAGEYPSFFLPGDLNGSEPNPPGSLFIDDVWIRTDDEGWLTTSGQELVVPFDPTDGAAIPVVFEGSSRLSVPTAFVVTGSFQRSNGTSVSSFTTNFTSGVLRVGNRLLVTTSNFAQVGSSPVLNPGTVLLFDVSGGPGNLVVVRATPSYVVTSDPNPTALTPLAGGRVAVTNSGVIRTGNPATATGPASVDLLDAGSGQLVASIPFGNAGLTYDMLALDPTGSAALAGSAVFRRLYALDLRGVATLPAAAINPQLQRPSCSGATGPTSGGLPCFPERVIAGLANPIALPPCPGCSPATDGYTADVHFGAAGDFAVATEFNDGLVAALAFDPRNLASPHPLLASRFGAPHAFVVTAPVGTFGQEYGPGPLLLRASATGSLDGTIAAWLTLGPDGTLMRGTFDGALATPTGDADADGVEDALDVCPRVANTGQQDSGGVASSLPDGIGDVCQCGDAGGDGFVRIDDVARVARAAASLPPALPAPERCNVAGVAGGAAGTCAADDALALRAALAGLAPPRQICAAEIP